MNKEEAYSQLTKKAIGYILLIFLVMIAFSIWFFYIGASLNKVLEYSLAGIPFGIILWSFIGNLIRLILIISSKTPIESPLRWIITRSCLSIFVGSASALLVSTFFIPIDYSIMYVLVFLVGYSNLPLQLVDMLQNTMVQHVNGPLDEKEPFDKNTL